ncbi:hypothetical protein MAR_007254 [Mya arenaria]|uniref:M-phase-specific PLK1-interacting protein n=1 Tax=Mya arenaria TaxID=6604 RepID=A0ABY7DFB6_MYAAR|nr:uncharacterized protein LOC128239040 isoform X1 [Mya arenaria]XP_052811989.1 uncharacterized protein LOC128239370 isoform X1 [Mya arenaria]WAQ94783.1 hypothetical protein MAR_007254 [Mya arenaria]
MDFIPFNQNTNLKQSDGSGRKNSPNQNMKAQSFGGSANKMPSFGSPALPFGSPAMNNSGNAYNRTPSPRHQSPYSPRGYNNGHSGRGYNHQGYNSRNSGHFQHNSMSPRHQFSPSHGPPMKYSPYSPVEYQRQMSEPANFKTPQSFGRGNGRKSFTKTFEKTPRFNCNPGGSNSIEDYYNSSMVEDPWHNLNPVLVQT